MILELMYETIRESRKETFKICWKRRPGLIFMNRMFYNLFRAELYKSYGPMMDCTMFLGMPILFCERENVSDICTEALKNCEVFCFWEM